MADESESKPAIPNESQVTPVSGIEVRKGIDIATAVSILQSIAATHEDTLDERSLDTLGQYSAEQVMEAIKLFGTHIIDLKRKSPSDKGIRKSVEEEGELALLLLPSISSRLPQHRGSQTLNMSFYNPVYSVDPNKEGVVAELPIASSYTWVDKRFIRFHDYHDKRREVSLTDLEDNFTFDNYKYIWRGMRWMSANMLLWDTVDIVRPNDLDAKSSELASKLSYPPAALQE